MTIEFNEDFIKAQQLITETNDNIFITGKAGTGKTTFLKECIKKCGKKTVILAPTGVAALNSGGETIHSFFKFKTDITLAKISKKKKQEMYKNIDTIVIDEASMLRADLLDCIDKFLRLNGRISKLPFGGAQMVFIGDLHQLPPVVTADEQYLFKGYYDSPYFFSAKSLQDTFCHIIEFKKIYRQVDNEFIDVLNAVRNNSVNDRTMEVLNKRVGKNFVNKKLSVYLTTTNRSAEAYNEKYLQKLPGETNIFTAETEDIENTVNFPVNYQLKLKVGAQVMMLNNDSGGRWVNGTLGIIKSIVKSLKSDTDIIYVQMETGKTEEVEPYKWELFKYKWNEELKQIDTEKAGSFSQYPLKLAWAVTIHKSQGKTFDNVMIDLGCGAFAPGQLYVALSRCKTINGISLIRPVRKSDVLVDDKIGQLLKNRERINYLTDPKYKLV
jgi:ATP-dependent exoDNAse (exonuclease V) alpha subunit